MEIFRSYDRGRLGAEGLRNSIIQLFEGEDLKIVVEINKDRGTEWDLDTIAILLSSQNSSYANDVEGENTLEPEAMS